MNKQTEKRELVERAIKTCIAIETSGGEFHGNRLTKQILRVLNELGVVIIDRERKLPKNLEVNLYYEDGGNICDSDALDEAGYVATIPLIEEGK